MTIDIRQYSADKVEEWDQTINNSKNGTFLLLRRYMDYHADRFTDHSLMFYNKNRCIAVLPANTKEDVLYSHQGLTYGGLIMTEECTTAVVMEIFRIMNEHLIQIGVKRVIYKPIPYIYTSIPSEEDLYALFRLGATIHSRSISSTIDYNKSFKWSELRRRQLNKAHKNGIKVHKTQNISKFWEILTDNLIKRHNTHPVHTEEEMTMLIDRFPENIELYEALNCNGDVVGGILAYKSTQVLHTQYISASEEGRQLGAIEAIIEVILKEKEFKYLDFGISTENGGQYLNEGLISQKEGFSGRGICYDTYEYKI